MDFFQNFNGIKLSLRRRSGGAIVLGMNRNQSRSLSRPPLERMMHIHKAIAELEETKRELKEADHDFGGHRIAAIKQCDEALAQLRQCLKFDRK